MDAILSDGQKPSVYAFIPVTDIKPLIDLVFADRMVFHKGDVTLAPGIEFLLIGGIDIVAATVLGTLAAGVMGAVLGLMNKSKV